MGPGTPEVQLWRQQGRACWALPGHPGWGLLHIAVEDFEAVLPPGSGASALLPAELAVPCRQDVMARLANLPPAEQLLVQGQAPSQAGTAGGFGIGGGIGGAAAAGAGGVAAGPGPAAGPAPSAATAPAMPAPAAPAAAAAEQQPPPSPAQLAFEGQAAAPAGPEAYAAGPGAGGAAAGGGQALMDQEPLASPYETAMRLPSLPLLGDMFPSLPKASRAGCWRV